MKQFRIIGLAVLMLMVALSTVAFSANPLQGDGKEEYCMVTFLSGIEYWKGCYAGFKDAGKMYNVKTTYDGSPEYDINKSVTVLEQVIARKPAGLAITCINPDAYIEPIKKAMAMGIPVVTFDADAPKSGRYAFLATGNYSAGAMAAKRLGNILKGVGEVAVITLPGQLNHEERKAGFVDAIGKDFPKMKVVQIANGKDQAQAAQAAAGIIQSNPNVKGIFCSDATSGVGAATAVQEAGMVGKIKIVSFDTDKGTLDAIKEGTIDSSIAQGTWTMGFWSLQFLYQLKHNLINPVTDWKKKGISPLPNYVDTGVSIVTKENVNSFYVK